MYFQLQRKFVKYNIINGTETYFLRTPSKNRPNTRNLVTPVHYQQLPESLEFVSPTHSEVYMIYKQYYRIIVIFYIKIVSIIILLIFLFIFTEMYQAKYQLLHH